MLKTPLERFRLIGWLEGASFLALLLVAMPLKHAFGMPLPVKVVGWAHGALFLAYLASLIDVWVDQRWPLRRVALAAVASLVPGGPFIFDAWLRRTSERTPQAAP